VDEMLSVKGVSLSYDGNLAVQNVSFSLYKGENLCLIGSNGSGKSTLIKGILGLMRPDAGTIDLKCGLGAVSYLAQIQTADRDFPATVREVVLSGTQTSGRRLPFYTKSDRERAEHAMALMQVDSFADRRIGHLSGGQQQRALLARAVARNPELLILDEPCSALDPEITCELCALFDRLRTEFDLTLLISTHDLGYVRRSADRVAVLNQELDFIGPVSAWLEWREDEHG